MYEANVYVEQQTAFIYETLITLSMAATLKSANPLYAFAGP